MDRKVASLTVVVAYCLVLSVVAGGEQAVAPVIAAAGGDAHTPHARSGGPPAVPGAGDAAPTPHHAHHHLHKGRCIGTVSSWCGGYYTQAPVPYKRPPRHNKPCPGGCSGVGVCSGDTGVCDCPAGVHLHVTRSLLDWGVSAQRLLLDPEAAGSVLHAAVQTRCVSRNAATMPPCCQPSRRRRLGRPRVRGAPEAAVHAPVPQPAQQHGAQQLHRRKQARQGLAGAGVDFLAVRCGEWHTLLYFVPRVL